MDVSQDWNRLPVTTSDLVQCLTASSVVVKWSAATATLELMDTPPMALPGNEALAHQARRRAAARCWGSRRVCRPG